MDERVAALRAVEARTIVGYGAAAKAATLRVVPIPTVSVLP